MENNEEEVYLDDDGKPIRTAVAIDRDKNSQFAVKWAVENLRLRNKRILLVHVNAQKHANDKEAMEQLQQLFLPYRGFCARKGIRAKVAILNQSDVVKALSDFITSNGITAIALGSSNRGAFARAFRYSDVPTSVAKFAPASCSVYAVSKGKAVEMKVATESFSPISVLTNKLLNELSPRQGSRRSASTDASLSSDGSKNSSPIRSRSYNRNGIHSPRGRPSFSSTFSPLDSVSSSEILSVLSWENRLGIKKTASMESPTSTFDYASSLGSGNCSSPENSRTSDGGFSHKNPTRRHSGGKYFALQQSSNYQNLRGRNLDYLSRLSSVSCERSESNSFYSDTLYEIYDHHMMEDSSLCSASSQMHDTEEELKRVRTELMQMTDLYNAACREAVTARVVLQDLVHWQSEEVVKLEEAKKAQETAIATAEIEKQKSQAAVELAQKAQRIADLETEKRKYAEIKFKQEAEEKRKAMEALFNPVSPYRKYSIHEIEAAANNFSSSNKIGEGSYGPVYKAVIDYTPVAIKVLKSELAEGQKQFQREVEVLSSMRHPNLVILLGACPEHGCLVYEYMENLCLEDRLFCKDGTPPLPWFTRFRIATEVATALNFLHQTRPDAIVHRDLKPANILLDRNFVSKISDVGLSTLVPASVADKITQYRLTAAVGTFCYIDPEYQQTGTLGTESDIYSLGVLLLQLITGKPPMGLTFLVQNAIETGQFTEALDQTAGGWPINETLSFAKLALKCCELRRRDRPNLDSIILPELERLREIGFAAESSG